MSIFFNFCGKKEIDTNEILDLFVPPDELMQLRFEELDDLKDNKLQIDRVHYPACNGTISYLAKVVFSPVCFSSIVSAFTPINFDSFWDGTAPRGFCVFFISLFFDYEYRERKLLIHYSPQ